MLKERSLDEKFFSEKVRDAKVEKCVSSSASPGKYVQFLAAIPLKNTQQGCSIDRDIEGASVESVYRQAGERKRKAKKKRGKIILF